MDFDDSPPDARFRVEARRWLASRARPRAEGRRAVVPFIEHGGRGGEESRWVQACRDWQRTKYEGGYGGISWPGGHGGRDGTRMQEIIFAQEESQFDVALGAFAITLGMVAPTILIHGTDDQRAHLPRILAGDEIWCQLYSEPSAGSDLAGIDTKAVWDDVKWIVTGQKVWTSGAHYADWGYLLARSDPTAGKHAGLTTFIFPMDA